VLQIGVLSAYGEDDWHAQRIARAAAQHHHVDLLAPTDFAAEITAGATQVLVRGKAASRYDLFLTPRALGDEGDADVQVELYRALLAGGARLVNDVDALLVAIDKFRTSWELARAGLPTPDVRVVQRTNDATRALVELEQVVAKPVYGSLGIGVERIDAGQEVHLEALLAQHGALYLQRLVADVTADVRAFVVGDRVVQSVVRRAPRGEFRANLRCGAAIAPFTLSTDVARLAVRASEVLGLDYAGVDLLLTKSGVQLIEVNGTPSFRGIYEATGHDMAEAIVAHAIRHGPRRSATAREASFSTSY
jgi:ribosomal protein S6--L-glutamate ligase